MKHLAALTLIVAFALPPLPSLAYGTSALNSTYKEIDFAWSIQTPRNWKKQESMQGDMDIVTFFSPGKAASLRVIANPYTYGANAKENLEAYMEEKQAALGHDLSQFYLLEDEDTTLRGQPARLLVATWYDGPQKDKTEVLVTSYNGVIYEITTTARDAEWEQYEDVFEASIDTFAFSKKQSLKHMPWGEEKFRKFAVGTKLKNASFVGNDNDLIDGGAGIDTGIYSGDRDEYTLYRGKAYPKEGYKKTVIVVYEETGDMDVLVNVELLRFDDQTLALPSFKVKE